MKFLMPAGGCRITLRTTLVSVTSRGAAVADRISTGDHAVFTHASSARVACWRQGHTVSNFSIFEPATEPAFLCGVIVLLVWTEALVPSFGVDTLSARVTRVPPLDRLIVAFVDVETLRALSAIVKSASIAGFTTTIVPARHVEAGRRLVASVKIARAFVQVELTTVTDVTASTGTPSWCHALATVLTGLIADRFAGVAIARVAILACAIVAASGVDTGRLFVARMMAGCAFVELSAVEFVDPMVTRKTLARVGADHVHALRISVTMVTLGATLLLALIYVWTKLATLFGHAYLLARWTRQSWTFCFRVEPLAGEATVETVALDALFRRDFLTVIVNYAA